MSLVILKGFLLFLIIINVPMSGYVHMSTVPMESKERVLHPTEGVIGSCELADVVLRTGLWASFFFFFFSFI